MNMFYSFIATVIIFSYPIQTLAKSTLNTIEPGKRLVLTSENNPVWMSFEELNKISEEVHKRGHCGGYMDITDFRHVEARPPIPFDPFDIFQPNKQDLVIPLLKELSANNIYKFVEKLSSFQNRYYKSETGVQAAHWIRDQFKKMAEHRSDVTVELVEHSFAQPSVIARIQGQGEHASEIIVLGAHEDSINQSSSWMDPNARAPGADDDASGTSTVLEIFRVLVESDFKPNRTIEFMTYAGEEVGLLGSQDIAYRYRDQGKNVIAALQFDMTLYPGETREMTFISDYVDRQLTDFLEMLVDEYVKVPWREDKCGYACSDHASWNRAGFPSAFPFESPSRSMNPKIHTVNDTLQNYLDVEFGMHFAQLGLAYAIEAAKVD